MANNSMNLIVAKAECSVCDWFVEAKNAQGVGSQHADKAGHKVEFELVYHGEALPE